MTSVFGYCKADPNIPIDELDYGYIEKCKDINKLQKILEILRSGEEGRYPALEQFTEKQLAEKNPDSPLLEKCSKEKTLHDLSKSDIEKTVEELKNLSSCQQPFTSSSEKERVENDDGIPPVRSKKVATTVHLNETKQEEATTEPTPVVKKMAAPKGPEYWENVTKEVDADKDGDYTTVCKEKSSKSIMNVASSKPVHELLSQLPIDHDRLQKNASFSAENEKNKGNEAFRCGDYEEALVYYNRSLDILPTVAAYNNRAITLIKLEKFNEALTDSEKVINLDPSNIKAYMRRGIAYQSLGHIDEAHVDFAKVVELEPTNKRGKELLAKVAKELEKKNLNPKKKGTRMKIEEINTNADQNYEKSNMDIKESKQATEIVSDNVNHKLGDEKMCNGNDIKKAKITENCVNIIDTNDSCSLANVMKCINSQNNIKTVTDSKICDNNNLAISGRSESLGNKSDENSAVVNTLPVAELPADVINMKDMGNKLYKSGQYDKACEKYTYCIDTLSKNPVSFHGALATFFSNRSSCFAKMGNSKQSISDCDKSIELTPSAKVYLKRACAYESLEKYIDAYRDYEIVFKLDPSSPNVLQSLSRLGNALRLQYGEKWRDKVPKTTNSAIGGKVDENKQSNSSVEKTINLSGTTSTEAKNKAMEKSKISLESEIPKLDESEGSCNIESKRVDLKAGKDFPGINDSNRCKTMFEDHVPKAEAKQKECQNDMGTVETLHGQKLNAGCNKDKALEQNKTSKETDASNLDQKQDKKENVTKESVAHEAQKKPVSDRAITEEKINARCTKEKLAKEKRILDFFETKERGNNLVQKEKYEEAAKCYTQCVELLPKEIPSYTNRALCYLKLKQPVKAIEDCTQALKLQPSCVKALFRRAQARKMTKEYKEALADLTKVLKIEPNNNAAKKELEVCKADFHAELRNIQAQNEAAKKKDSAGKSRKVPIEEVDSSEFSVKGKMSTKVGKCPLAKGSTPRSTPLKKMTGFEFLHAWNSVKSDKTADYADLLVQIEPTKLPDLFSNKLDGEILKNFIRTVNEHFTNKDTYKQGIQLFKSLCKVSRFVTMLMFLNTTEKTLLRCAIDQLENRVKQSNDKSLLSEVNSLRTSYRCP